MPALRSTPRPASIVLGTGDFFWNSNKSDSDKIDIITRAISLGVSIIDTAEEYGTGASERLVGRAISAVTAKPLIATKFSPQHHAYQDLVAACERSLKNLQVDAIDIYQMHWPNPAIALEEVARGLSDLFQQGKILSYGVGNCSLREAKELQRLASKVPLRSVQMEYNLFERTVEENGMLAFCREQDLSLLAYSALDQGRINSIPTNQQRVLENIASLRKLSISQVILCWIMSKSPILPIVRTTSQQHLVENLQAQQYALTQEEQQQIDAAFPINYQHISPKDIRVAKNGEWSREVYQTLADAVANPLGFVPSPVSLAEAIKAGDCLKPVRLVRNANPSDGFNYELIGGRIRYWAWVIAFGEDKPIPAYIR